jgi:hypothetical protein
MRIYNFKNFFFSGLGIFYFKKIMNHFFFYIIKNLKKKKKYFFYKRFRDLLKFNLRID